MLRWRVLALIVVSALVLGTAEAAFAAAPPTSPMTVMTTEGFEGATPSYLTIEPFYPIFSPSAWWAPIGFVHHSGSKALWCAGSTAPGSWPSNYPEASGGRATFDLPQLQDYYSSRLTFWYTMPSLGDDDGQAFLLSWWDARYTFGASTHHGLATFPLTSEGAWRSSTWDLSDPADAGLSRKPGKLMFQWYDAEEAFGQVNLTGEGPSIDDVAITGYKYGPVRSLTATHSAGNVVLSWQKPYGSKGSTAEDARTVGYRVWRALDSAPTDWTELTTGRTTSLSFTDTSPSSQPAHYFVQAWDPAAGGSPDGYGDPSGSTVAVGVAPPEPTSIDLEHDGAGVHFDRWVTGFSSLYSGGGYVYGRWTDTWLSARFTGTKIAWVGPKQPNYGMADVYVDGVKVATADCYAKPASATLSATIFSSDTLSQGPHTLTLRLTGSKNASSTGTIVVLDKLVVTGLPPALAGTRTDDASATPGYTGTWLSATNVAYYNKTYRYSRWSSAAFTATFSGTKVAWIGPRTPFYGMADVYIDDVKVATVDEYRASPQGWRETVWESEALPAGTHTIRISPTGTKNPASTYANIVVDAIDVTP